MTESFLSIRRFISQPEPDDSDWSMDYNQPLSLHAANTTHGIGCSGQPGQRSHWYCMESRPNKCNIFLCSNMDDLWIRFIYELLKHCPATLHSLRTMSLSLYLWISCSTVSTRKETCSFGKMFQLISCIVHDPGANPWVRIIVLIEVSESSSSSKTRQSRIGCTKLLTSS